MDLYRLNLNLLIALDALLLEQSVTLAAKKLFITQAAMSNNLQQLRNIFKDDLLIREKNHMVLTSYARELQPKLHQVLQEIHSLVISGQRFEPETSERVFKIGVSDYMAVLLLPKLIAHLAQTAPEIKISVVSVYHLSGIEPFERGDYDLAIGKVFEISSPIRKELLFKDFGVVVVNRNHKLARKKKITLKDYLSYKHIVVRADNPHFPPVIEQALAKKGFRRNAQISLPFIIPIFKLLEKSDELIATVIHSMTVVYKKNSDFVVKPLPFEIPEIEFFVAWHQRYDNDPGHKWLRQQIKEVSKSLGV